MRENRVKRDAKKLDGEAKSCTTLPRFYLSQLTHLSAAKKEEKGQAGNKGEQ
jgi:hypothetical protein